MDTLYRINRLLMFTVMLLYVPLTLALVAAMCWGGYWLTTGAVRWLSSARMGLYSHGAWLFFILLADLALGGVSLALLAGLYQLLTRFQHKPQVGLLLSGGSHRHFFELLERVCKKLKVRPPDECYLSPFSEMSIGDRIPAREDDRGRKKTRTLVVGAALLVHIRIDELTTILCHEMAHAKAGDTRLSWTARRFYHALASAIYAQYEGEAESFTSGWLHRPVRIGLVAFHRLFSLVYAADERWCELRADRLAAETCGAQNTRNALIKIHLPDYIPELSIEALVGEYSQDESDMGNIYEEHRRRWAELPARRRENAENEMFLERHSFYASHPCLAARIRALRGVDAKEVTGDKPATMLFANWEHLEATMTERLVSRARYLNRTYMRELLTEGRE